MCAWLDLDQSGKDRAGPIAQRVFVKQIAGGVRLEEVLERALIEFLISTGNRDREHVTPGAAADHPADAFQTRISPAEIEREIKYRGVTVRRGRVNLDGNKITAPVLSADVCERRAWAATKLSAAP